MASIVTNDNLSPLDETKTNFPALVFRAKYEDCDFVNKTITDPISGLIISFGNLQANGTDEFFVSNTGTVDSGTVPSPGTKNVVMLMDVAQLADDGRAFALGDPVNSPGFGIVPDSVNAGFFDYVTVSLTNYHTMPQNVLPNDTKNVLNMLTIDWTNDTTEELLFSDNSSSLIRANGTSTGTGGISAGISNIAQQVYLPSSTAGGASTYIRALYVMYTSSAVPSDMANAMRWMKNNPGRLYPGFADLKA